MGTFPDDMGFCPPCFAEMKKYKSAEMDALKLSKGPPPARVPKRKADMNGEVSKKLIPPKHKNKEWGDQTRSHKNQMADIKWIINSFHFFCVIVLFTSPHRAGPTVVNKHLVISSILDSTPKTWRVRAMRRTRAVERVLPLLHSI